MLFEAQMGQRVGFLRVNAGVYVRELFGLRCMDKGGKTRRRDGYSADFEPKRAIVPSGLWVLALDYQGFALRSGRWPRWGHGAAAAPTEE